MENMDAPTAHRNRILAAVRREEVKRDQRPPKEEPQVKRRPRKRIRWDMTGETRVDTLHAHQR